MSLGAVMAGVKAEIRGLVEQYAYDGDEHAFGVGMIDALRSGHKRAAIMGRERAGDTAPEDADDAGFAEMVMDGQTPYIDGFVQDLGSGRYEGEDGALDTAAVTRRAESYANRMVGTANETFSLASGDDAIEWVLGGAEEHCPDCPRIAAGNPYTGETLPTYPGACDTQCLYNCGCSLRRSDGTEGFESGA